MRKIVSKFALAAGIMLAMAFTLSCSSDDNSGGSDDGGGGGNPSIKKETFTDSRDGKNYTKIKIGTQTWMAENLNYDVPNNETDVCYENSADSCAKYGRMYNWNTAMTACPIGWHLPSDDEWTALTDAVGDETVVGKKLKSKSGWYGTTGNGTDDYGFAALPGGIISGPGGAFLQAGSWGVWWSATEYSASRAWLRRMNFNDGNVTRYDLSKGALFSVRCVQD